MQSVYAFDESSRREAAEWLDAVRAVTQKEPLSQLFSMFKRASTVLVVNRANGFMKRVCAVWEDFLPELTPADEAALRHRQSCGLYLYYRVLQGLLREVEEPPPGPGSPVQPSAAAVSADEELQLSLLTCAAEVATFALDAQPSSAFPTLTQRLGRLGQTLGLWHAVGQFWEHLPAPEEPGAPPESVRNFLTFMRVRITEQLAWLDGSSLYGLMQSRAAPADTALLEAFLTATNRLAASRVRAVVGALKESVPEFGRMPSIEDDCLEVLDALLVPNLDLLFNQHLSNLVACCIYGAARRNNIVLSFKRILAAMQAAVPHHSPDAFQTTELAAAAPGRPAERGDTRALYNQVFLPRMQGVLTPKEPPSGDKGRPVSRLPLTSLTAGDMNVRAGASGRMAGMRE